ncbi:hypothetical protein [Modicisalibacter luteus]|uniref:Uncharacterized protein n=1 Tax=Modicisalibacter luteus TaxID=453962 RepID=A0ABV7M410_9GAMM|nr:hypothetical protein [Halomonas lutea]
MAKQGIAVQSTFDAGQLTGFILEGPYQQYLTAYQFPGSDQLVVGSLLDSGGSDLRDDHLYEQVYKENLGNVRKVLEGSKQGWIAERNPDALYVYLFDDPMCGYCHEFYKLTREAIEQGKLQLRHVMVGVVTAKSELVAVSFSAETSPPAMWDFRYVNLDSRRSRDEA